MSDYGSVVGISAPRWHDDSPSEYFAPTPAHRELPGRVPKAPATLRRNHTVNFRENLRVAQEGIRTTVIARDALDEAMDLLELLRTQAVHGTSGYLDTVERDHAASTFAGLRHCLSMLIDVVNDQDQSLFSGSYSQQLVISRQAPTDEILAIALMAVDPASLFLDRLSIDSRDNAIEAVEACDAAIERVSEQNDKLAAVQQRLEFLLGHLDALLNQRQNAGQIAEEDAGDRVRQTCARIVKTPDDAFSAQSNLLRLDSHSLVRPSNAPGSH